MQIYLTKRMKYIIDAFRDIFQEETWQHLKSCDVLLVRHDNDCGYTFHGQAYAQIIDSFGDLCEKRGLTVKTVATPHSRLICKYAYRSPVSYNKSFSLIHILGEIVGIIRGSDIKRKWVKQHQINLWCRILEKATPKYVIGIEPDEFLCNAGKLKRIPIYDLQHGHISDIDFFNGEIYRKETPFENLPDGFLCWDEQSEAVLSKWACNKGIRVLKIGNPWFLRFIYIKPEDLLVSEALTNCHIIDDNRPCIIVSLQWGLAILYPNQVGNGVIVKELEQVILNTEKIYNWILRLHPVQLRDNYEREQVLNYLNATFGAEKTKQWIRNTEIPLPVVLSKADLHITYMSSVVAESAWMGIRSGLLNKNLNPGEKFDNLFSFERSLGMADLLPQNTEAIEKWIIETLAKGRDHSTLKVFGQELDTCIDKIAKRDL